MLIYIFVIGQAGKMECVRNVLRAVAEATTPEELSGDSS
jgi:hypothetical protein